MNATLHNDRLLRALLRQPVDATPVWLMRQAGRYLPEYRAARARAGSFMALCQTPERACEVTLQPLARFALDAAILFSDILTVPDAMGLGLSFSDGEGPQFARPLRSAADIARLAVPDPETALRYVMDAVRLIRRELAGRAPLIGFAGSPWTLATYMVEGGSSKDYHRIKGLLYDQPGLLHRLLEVTAQAVTLYLNAQIAAGAQAVMIFDTWGGILAPRAYREFSLRYMAQIVAWPDPRGGPSASADHPVHQGRRGLAGSDSRDRLRCGRGGLDRRSRRRPAAGRGAGRATGQSRSCGVICRSRTHPRTGRAGSGRFWNRSRPCVQSRPRRPARRRSRAGRDAGCGGP